MTKYLAVLLLVPMLTSACASYRDRCWWIEEHMTPHMNQYGGWDLGVAAANAVAVGMTAGGCAAVAGVIGPRRAGQTEQAEPPTIEQIRRDF